MRETCQPRCFLAFSFISHLFEKMDLSALNSNTFYKIVNVKHKLSKTKNNIQPTEIDCQGEIEIRQLRQQQKRLTECEKVEIVAKYKAGISTYDLAKEYECHRYTISKHLKDAGVEVSNRVARKESLVGLILQLYSEWNKPSEIGKALGISADSVRRCLKENGIELRHSSAYARRKE